MVSLCPEGMLALSGSNNNNKPSKQQDLASNFSAPTSAAAAVTSSAATAAAQGSAGGALQTKANREMAKKAESGLEESVSNLVDVSTKLEQDQMESGVDEKEWVGVSPFFSGSNLFIYFCNGCNKKSNKF